MARRPSQKSILKHGPEIAAIKASMPPQKWRAFVAQAKKRGFTVAGALSGAPDPLKERTNKSLREQAEKTISAAYKPVTAELNRRDAAAGFLEQKRATDDAAYRQWIAGETDKLSAQARAADVTLAAQQSDIAQDLNAAQKAAVADSAQRMAQTAGNVSDPGQSTALDQTAADTRSREQVAAAREHTAAVTKIGAGADEMSRAAVLATAAVREATSTAEHWKTLAGITADRKQAALGQAKDTAGLLTDLKAGEVSKAQTMEELRLAGAELGVKKMDIVQQAKLAAKKYGLENRKFSLDKWKADHADAIARAKVQLGYDEILARDGQKAADRALDRWAVKYREKHADARDDDAGGKKGITDDERETYRAVETVRQRVANKIKNGKTPAQIRKELMELGYDAVMIEVANDLARNGGVLSPAGADKARRLGIKHVGYFYGSYPQSTAKSPLAQER